MPARYNVIMGIDEEDGGNPASRMSDKGPAHSTGAESAPDEVFELGNEADPQRHIGTSRIFRAGSSALAVIAENGMIASAKAGETGLYVGDMRVVSTLSFTINGTAPRVSKARQDDTATEFIFQFEPPVRQVEAEWAYTLRADAIVGCLRLRNDGAAAARIVTDFSFAADHYDTFYVRFPPKPERGVLHPATLDQYGQTIRYESLTGREMFSFIRFSEEPLHVANGLMRFNANLSSQQTWQLIVQAGLDSAKPNADSWQRARTALRNERRIPFAGSAQIKTGNPRLSRWLRQSENDLSALTANLDTGLYPYAGLPWFAVPFGRDALITGLETIELNPAVIQGVLLHQAKYQARETDVFRQATPGKIMHEMRLGETSATGLNPYARYYGSVDTTPLFVVAAGAYWQRTADRSFLTALWPNIDLALHWMSDYGDLDDDGFIEYFADPGKGLSNQAWKDSRDAIVDENGDFATGLIAVSEVQAYAYAAWRAGQAMANALGLNERAAVCAAAANKLYQRFNEVFWQEDMGIYALALDGSKKPCRVRASNMAHLPWSGIVPPDRAQRVINELLGERLFSGWGIRTLAANEKRYNPALYHRGPCWPHEMAIAAWSARWTGDCRSLVRIAETILDTAEAFGYRLPELLCGYPRTEGMQPVRYRSANPLQSWAAGVAFAILQSALGLKVCAGRSEVWLDPSGLPPDWAPIEIHRLRLGASLISFRVEASSHGLVVRVLDMEGSPVTIRRGRFVQP